MSNIFFGRGRFAAFAAALARFNVPFLFFSLPCVLLLLTTESTVHCSGKIRTDTYSIDYNRITHVHLKKITASTCARSLSCNGILLSLDGLLDSRGNSIRNFRLDHRIRSHICFILNVFLIVNFLSIAVNCCFF
jgi:hypothetical protein